MNNEVVLVPFEPRCTADGQLDMSNTRFGHEHRPGNGGSMHIVMGQAIFSRELLTVNRLEYVHKRPRSRPTMKKYNGFLNQHAAANSLQEHSLPTVNGLVTVAAPIEVAQLQSLAASSASPTQQSSEAFSSATAPGILIPSCETSAL
jgi:hypothetical protein